MVFCTRDFTPSHLQRNFPAFFTATLTAILVLGPGSLRPPSNKSRSPTVHLPTSHLNPLHYPHFCKYPGTSRRCVAWHPAVHRCDINPPASAPPPPPTRPSAASVVPGRRRPFLELLTHVSKTRNPVTTPSHPGLLPRGLPGAL